jgi:hypothetical protein
MPRMKMIKDFGQKIPRDTVIKYNLYIYGTKDDLKDPECEIEFKVDLWIVNGTGRSGFHNKTVNSNYVARACVDLEKKELFKINKKTKRKKVIKAVNVDAVISAIEDIFIKVKK